ncbi:substrate-binding domain-containing protein [Aerococcaceae bacterium zg-BR9]|uniref:substrate-binding domain-containing protein n=1 Tax=Aerococcaceae bacterium zg-1292 TaxID=2774330 RepID=UPI0040642A7E|nr:substrate-binding domain-containing protein [Aerococcaceae bacterium zg-BR9]
MKKKLIAIIAVLLVVLGNMSFVVSGQEKKKPEDLTIGFSVSTLNNPAFVYLKDQVEAIGKENKTKIIVLDAQNDAATQANNIDDFIQQKVDAIIINPVDSSAITTSVEAANKANIPVVTVDRSSEGGKVLSLIVSDNVLGGKMAAEYLIDKLGENAKIGVVEGIPGASATRERGEGFTKAAKGKLDIVSSQSANFDRAEALVVTENMLLSNPEIKGIFAQNDEEALGALEAAISAGREDVVIIGFDGAQLAVESIKNKELDATIGQRFDEMARLSLESIYKYYAGEEVESEILAPVELISQDNIKE